MSVLRDRFGMIMRLEFYDVEELKLILLRGAALLKMARETPGRAVAKTHTANASVDGFNMIPHTLTDRAVYVVRDPRDVALSLADHLGIDVPAAVQKMGDPQSVLRKRDMANFISSWSVNVASWIKTPRFPVLVVRYEEMIEDIRAQFARVLAFFGIEPDDARMDYAVEATRFDKLREHEDAIGFLHKSEHQERFFRTRLR